MNNQNVYIVICGKTIISVFDSKEKAFYELPHKDEFTEVTQTIRTNDGEEEITPTEGTFYLGVPIYVHVIEHTEDFFGLPVNCPEDTTIYEIKEFKVK